MLTENQYQQLIACGYLEVASPTIGSRIYRIPDAGGLVQELLGHSDIRMTLSTYSHLLPTMQQGAAAIMDDVFGQDQTR